MTASTKPAPSALNDADLARAVAERLGLRWYRLSYTGKTRVRPEERTAYARLLPDDAQRRADGSWDVSPCDDPGSKARRGVDSAFPDWLGSLDAAVGLMSTYPVVQWKYSTIREGKTGHFVTALYAAWRNAPNWSSVEASADTMPRAIVLAFLAATAPGNAKERQP